MFGQTRFPVIGKIALSADHGAPLVLLVCGRVRSVGPRPGGRRRAPLEKINLPAGWEAWPTGRPKKSFAALDAATAPAAALVRCQGPNDPNVQVFEVIPLDRRAITQGPAWWCCGSNIWKGSRKDICCRSAVAWGTDAEQSDRPRDRCRLIAEVQKSAAKESGAGLRCGGRRGHVDRAVGNDDSPPPGQRPARPARRLVDAASGPDGRRRPANCVRRPPAATSATATAVFGDKLILTLFRQLGNRHQSGASKSAGFSPGPISLHVLPLVGALEYRAGREDTVTIGVLHRYVPNTVSGLAVRLRRAGAVLRAVDGPTARRAPHGRAEAAAKASLWDLASRRCARRRPRNISGHSWNGRPSWDGGPANCIWPWPRIMAMRTSRPSRFRRSISDRSINRRASWPCRRSTSCAAVSPTCPPKPSRWPHALLDRQRQLLDTSAEIVGTKIVAQRIRCHGDYHLGHVLYTGKDFLIVDFYGEPTLPLTARRIKRSVDRRSGRHGPFVSVRGVANARAIISRAAWSRPTPWPPGKGGQVLGALEQFGISAGVCDAAADSGLLPKTRSHWDLLLRFHLLAEAIYELRAAMAGDCSRPPLADLAWIGGDEAPGAE